MLLEQIILQLNNLGKLQQGGKICKDSKGMISLDSESKLQPFFRFIYGENKENTIEYIKTLLDSAFEMAETLMNNQYYNIYKFKRIHDISSTEEKQHNNTVKDLENLWKSLDVSIKGLDNLKITYKEYTSIITNLEYIIGKVGDKIIEIKSDIEKSHNKFIVNTNLEIHSIKTVKENNDIDFPFENDFDS